MPTATLRTFASWLERAVILIAVGALLFRASFYSSFPVAPGARYGTGDIIDYALGLVLFATSTACAVVGVILMTRVDAADKGVAYRPVLVGMTTFVVYYLVHPYVPTLGPATLP